MNETIFYYFYNLAHQSNFFDKIVIFFAVHFPFIVILSALIFLAYRRVPYKKIILVFFSSGLAWLVAKILKILIHTDRPFVEFSNVHALFSETSFAFPSGHAVFFMALAVSLFFYHKKVGYVFMFFALLVGIVRIIAGVHFPIDILGGFILGALVAYSLRNV